MRTNQRTGISYKIVDIIVILISLLLLIYTGIRAATLSFTFDESLSFNRFVSLRFMDIVSYKIVSSNNHMINTLFMKYISMLFGTNELLLRLPSLFSHLIYIIFSYRIIRKASSPYVVLAGFLFLNLNPFLLDYFSLARGYAMAVSFTVLSVYFLFNYIENNKTNNIRWSLIFAMLAVLSNFCLLIFYVSLIAVINIYWISPDRGICLKDLIKKNMPVLISVLLLVVIMFEPLRKLIKFKELYDGGNTGFWSDTVGSLIYSSLYGQSYYQIALEYVKYFILISILIMIITLVYRFYLMRWKIFSEKITVAFLLLFITCIVSVAQHILLHSLFLINRMALFFIPLFFIPLVLIFSDFVRIKKMKILSLFFLLIISGALIFHTISSLNTSSTLMWRYDADTKKMLSDLGTQVKNSEKTHIKLGVVWLFEPTSNFYRTTKKYEWLDKVTWDNYRTLDYDYYFLADSCMSFIKANNLSVIRHYPVSNSYLLK